MNDWLRDYIKIPARIISERQEKNSRNVTWRIHVAEYHEIEPQSALTVDAAPKVIRFKSYPPVDLQIVVSGAILDDFEREGARIRTSLLREDEMISRIDALNKRKDQARRGIALTVLDMWRKAQEDHTPR